jgi:hypothetical protein
MSAPTAQEIYQSSVKNLPPSERLRLAALILQELAQANTTLVEHGDDWSEEDVRDMLAYSAGHAANSYPEEDTIA